MMHSLLEALLGPQAKRSEGPWPKQRLKQSRGFTSQDFMGKAAGA